MLLLLWSVHVYKLIYNFSNYSCHLYVSTCRSVWLMGYEVKLYIGIRKPKRFMNTPLVLYNCFSKFNFNNNCMPIALNKIPQSHKSHPVNFCVTNRCLSQWLVCVFLVMSCATKTNFLNIWIYIRYTMIGVYTFYCYIRIFLPFV